MASSPTTTTSAATPPGRHVVQVCRAEACQACGADALLAHAERTLGCERHDTTRRRRAARWSRCTAWACAPRRRPCRSTTGCTRASRRSGSTRWSAQLGAAAMSARDASTCRATPPRWRSAPTRWPPRSQREARARGLAVRHRAQRLARPVLAGAAGRGGHARRAASPTGRCRPRMWPALFDAGLLHGGAHPLCHGPDRGDPLPGAAGAPDLRAHRHHRPAVAGRLRGARRLGRACGARCSSTAPSDRAAGARLGPARPRRRGLSGRHQVEDGAAARRPRRSTSSAMPTKATRAPSPTA